MSKNLTKFVNHVTIKLRMRNTLSQESFQITFVFTNERKISITEFREGFAKFVTPVSLFKEFVCDCSVAYVKIFNRRTSPCKTNISFVIILKKIMPLLMEQSKSKMAPRCWIRLFY